MALPIERESLVFQAELLIVQVVHIDCQEDRVTPLSPQHRGVGGAGGEGRQTLELAMRFFTGRSNILLNTIIEKAIVKGGQVMVK